MFCATACWCAPWCIIQHFFAANAFLRSDGQVLPEPRRRVADLRCMWQHRFGCWSLTTCTWHGIVFLVMMSTWSMYMGTVFRGKSRSRRISGKKNCKFVTNFGPMGPKRRFYKVFVFRLLIWVGKKKCFHMFSPKRNARAAPRSRINNVYHRKCGAPQQLTFWDPELNRLRRFIPVDLWNVVEVVAALAGHQFQQVKHFPCISFEKYARTLCYTIVL